MAHRQASIENMADGKTRAMVRRLRERCRNTDCNNSIMNCEKCPVVAESREMFGYNVLREGDAL